MCKMAGVKRRAITDSDAHAFHKELDEVSCPICMEHPHNAVLLLCSSHEKGCRSYICDTSYRHSNCLDRFKKLRDNSSKSPILPHPTPINPQNSITADMNLRTVFIEGNGSQNLNEINLDSQGEGIVDTGESFQGRAEFEEVDTENTSNSKSSLKCPFCGGSILGWKVVEEARKYLNLKKRTCSKESCSYSGNYQELRRHARRVHPMTRPSDIDPSRERAWRRLEHQRGYDDTLSAIRSAMPGAVVVGDYVIEDGDRLAGERENGTGEAWWTTFFLFQSIGSVDSAREPRARSRVWSRHRRPERRFLWGENILGLQDEDNEGDVRILSDGDASPIPRRRRRLMRPRSDEDQP
ncbi:hypothetical protein F3Y22_tig00111086pilonHSYRG00018 [Hibiscus syriacus]|uniref:Uncharacterized protein n=1 Tax=Hibiscus syriacus TaxID=106335 RepID=A0A6A2Z2H5_HIBSY|nr:uncharacterized protein LOC120152151 [Hibiscus syriacus]XP_039020361.1 uncharacterized protein LOC120152151 [Hibiscus syriacus]KAE8686068.1 hypothetical protein F3Y22_tig00111086pilonHSYRG00018 [Hibiscus syriacus]